MAYLLGREDAYKLSKPNSILGELQRDILKRYGDGTPFRWMHVRDAYERAWKKIKGKGKKKINYEVTSAATISMKRSAFIGRHPSPHLGYNGGYSYRKKGIWFSVIPQSQFEECARLKRDGLIERDGYNYDGCDACHRIHDGMYKLIPIPRSGI